MKAIYSKVLVFMVALLFVFTFAGCDKQQSKTETETEKTTQETPSSDESLNPTKQPAKDSASSEETVISEDADSFNVEDAKVIALKHAGLSADDVDFVIAKYDNDVYVPHYDIEFTADGYEYDYEINAQTGAIIEFDKELDDNAKNAKTDSSDFITAESAKDIALEHAGLSEKDISGYQCELDKDDLIQHFEIEFTSGQYEYEYEINAITGNIMFSEKEFDD